MRLFYYDAPPYAGSPHHPFQNKQIDFSRTTEATFRLNLFNEIRRKRKFALRLGETIRTGGSHWIPHDRHLKEMLKIWHDASEIKEHLLGNKLLKHDNLSRVLKSLETRINLGSDNIRVPLRQKAVDMRIGLDITTMMLKIQVDTIVLLRGDSDFIPVAKIARREGAEFILGVSSLHLMGWIEFESFRLS